MLSRIRSLLATKLRIFLISIGLLGSLNGIACAQSGPGYVMPPGSTVQNNLFTAPAGAAPTCTNCTIVTGSSNSFGALTVTATGVVPLTFGGSGFTNTPVCLMTDNTTHESVTGTPSATGITFSGGATSDVLAWICVGH